MPLLCVFSHPRPRLSGFIPAQRASSLARSWGQNREHSEPIFAPPPTRSSPCVGGDRPLSHTANHSITKWKGCVGKMGLAAARWGKQGGSVWAAGWEEEAFLWSLEGWTTLKQRRPSLGNGKSAGPSPPACHVCFAASLWLSVGLHQSSSESTGALDSGIRPKWAAGHECSGPLEGFQNS